MTIPCQSMFGKEAMNRYIQEKKKMFCLKSFHLALSFFFGRFLFFLSQSSGSYLSQFIVPDMYYDAIDIC